jgi:hypothetical protein
MAREALKRWWFRDGADFGNDLTDAPSLISGTGSPEGAVTANTGSLYLRMDGGAGTTIYVKETGTGNTGWVAYSSTGGGGGGWTFDYAQLIAFGS